MSTFKKKKPGAYRRWLDQLSGGDRMRYRMIQGMLVLAVLLVGGCVFLSSWIRVPEIPAAKPAVSTTPEGDASQNGGVTFEGADLPEVAKSGRKEGYYTFLVAGRDVYSGATDTMLLFTFDSRNKSLSAISLPRDTMINTSAASKRLNAVFGRNRGSSKLSEQERADNGMTALKKEVSKLTGIYPDFYVLVEWDAIGELVDALGGVEYDVPYDMHYDDPIQDLHIHQEKGLRVLNGDDAMQVIRWRKNNSKDGGLQVGDDGRMGIQQEFLKAVLKECMDPAVILRIPSLAKVFLDNVNTDLTVGNLLAFAQLAIGIDLQNGIRFSTMPYTGVSYNRASMVVPVESKLLELLNDGINPYLQDIRAEDLQLVYKKSDGSFGVTNGEVADPAMEKAPAPKPAEEEPQEPAEETPEEEPGQTPAEGEQPSGETGLEGLPELMDPEQVLPEPEQPPSAEAPETLPEEESGISQDIRKEPEQSAAAA